MTDCTMPAKLHGIRLKIRLIETLWGWTICAECRLGAQCAQGDCPISRLRCLEPFWRCIQKSAEYFEIRVLPGGSDVNFENIFSILGRLKANSSITRDELVLEIASGTLGNPPLAGDHQLNAVRLAVRCLLMVDCCGRTQTPNELESGHFKLEWLANEKIQEYALKQIVQGAHSFFANPDAKTIKEVLKGLRAGRLQKRGRLRFRATDKMNHHLWFDRDNRTVEVFHHTSFLKECLLASKTTSAWEKYVYRTCRLTQEANTCQVPQYPVHWLSRFWTRFSRCCSHSGTRSR